MREQGQKALGFSGATAPDPSGILTFGMRDPAQNSTKSSRSPWRLGLSSGGPGRRPLAPPLGAYLGFTGLARRWRQLSSGPAPGAGSPWAGSGASRPAGKASFPRAPCSALWRSLSLGAAGVL